MVMPFFRIFEQPSPQRHYIDRTLRQMLYLARNAKAAGIKPPYTLGLVIDEDEDGEFQITQYGNIFIDDTGFNLLETKLPNTRQKYDAKEGEYIVEFELPGVQKEKIDVDIKEKELKITAAGSDSNQYEKTITFPKQIDPSTAKAKYENGILTLRVKPKEPEKPKVVKVNIE